MSEDFTEFEERFQEVFSTIAEMYGQNPSTFLFELWFNALKRFDIKAIDKAFSVHVQDPDRGQFMPKPADIIRIIEGSHKDHAFNAWTFVEKAIGRVGGYESVVFDDPIIHRVIQDMGGWVRICGLPEKDMPFTRNEFMNRYSSFKTKGEIPEYPSKLIGIIEGENRASGYLEHIPDPKLIGDPEKANNVLLLGSNKPSLGISTGSGFKQLTVKQPKCLN